MVFYVMSPGAGFVGNELIFRDFDEVVHHAIAQPITTRALSLLCSSVSHFSCWIMAVTLSCP